MAEDIAIKVANMCQSLNAKSLRGYFGDNLLRTKPEELDGMVGNVATLLMAQTVCYVKSQGEVSEALRADRQRYSHLFRMVELCKQTGSNVRKVRR